MCLLLQLFCLLLLLPRYGVWSMPLVMLAVALILVILVSVVTGATLGGSTAGHPVLQLESTDSKETDPWVDQPGPWIDQEEPRPTATKAARSSLETTFKKVMIDNRHFAISKREQSSR